MVVAGEGGAACARPIKFNRRLLGGRGDSDSGCHTSVPLSSVGKVEHKAGRLGKTHIKQMFVCHCADATSLNGFVIRLTQSDPRCHPPPNRGNGIVSNAGTLSLSCCGVFRQRRTLMDSFILLVGKKRKKRNRPRGSFLRHSLGVFILRFRQIMMKYLCRLAGISNGKCGFFLSKWGPH